MIEPGRLCMKIAGRDAGRTCVVVDVLTDKFVMIDGETRRKRCNIQHKEPLKQSLDIKKGASREDVKSAFKKLGIVLKDKKPKQKAERPKPQVKAKTETKAIKEAKPKQTKPKHPKQVIAKK
ncbi:50S ribosomal protein L14e [Candidatus Woesearchaeota archaeon]|nr:50S ribosomal protein L14e [Candidatus Woesearchaeota archaeon]